MSRKYPENTSILSRHSASMGPRQKCLGNCIATQRYIAGIVASMGPRQKCLGNRYQLRVIARGLDASMGPRQKCLGNTINTDTTPL